MGQICWQAGAGGRYHIDVFLGNQSVSVMIDTGLVDSAGQVGFELEPALFDQLANSGFLISGGDRKWRNASGVYGLRASGETAAQLRDPSTKARVGPVVRLSATRGTVGLPSRVGVVFFHSLTGCRVLWDLDGQARCIEYP
jgi:hypothetical protein